MKLLAVLLSNWMTHKNVKMGQTQPMAVKAALKNTKYPSYLFNAQEIGHGGHE